MKNASKHSVAIISVAILFLGMFPKMEKGIVNMKISDYVGENILTLDSVKYKNELKQDFTVGNFKYYVGNFCLTNDEGKQFKTKNYYLINAADSSSLKFSLGQVPAGKYISMKFTLGVDSANNCSGAQAGALDPVNAMFWAWNTGYIFLKLEGKSSYSKSMGNNFEFHIGGFKTPNNCIRTVTIDLKNNPIIVENENVSSVYLKADAAEVLKTPTTIDFSKLSSVIDFHNATTIADNYKDMFSLLKVEHEK